MQCVDAVCTAEAEEPLVATIEAEEARAMALLRASFAYGRITKVELAEAVRILTSQYDTRLEEQGSQEAASEAEATVRREELIEAGGGLKGRHPSRERTQPLFPGLAFAYLGMALGVIF